MLRGMKACEGGESGGQVRDRRTYHGVPHWLLSESLWTRTAYPKSAIYVCVCVCSAWAVDENIQTQALLPPFLLPPSLPSSSFLPAFSFPTLSLVPSPHLDVHVVGVVCSKGREKRKGGREGGRGGKEGATKGEHPVQ